jgi:16S rRNA (adenine(1408)-N(1))-methyltransferase
MPQLQVESFAPSAGDSAAHSLGQLRDSEFNVCDVGAGDGKYAIRLARTLKSAVVVAIDAEGTRMRKSAQRLKGRAPENLLFWIASLDAGIPSAREMFDEIHVILPWGSLLEGMLGLDMVVLGNVLDLGRPNARLIVVLNQRPWREGQIDRRTENLPSPSDAEVGGNVRGFLRERGWIVQYWSPMEESAARRIESSWSRRIAASQPPEFLRYEAIREDGPGVRTP